MGADFVAHLTDETMAELGYDIEETTAYRLRTFEEPSVEGTLDWAKCIDASDQCSSSRT